MKAVMKLFLLLFIVSVSFVFACSQNNANLQPKNSPENAAEIISNSSFDEIPKDWKSFETEVLSFYAPQSLKKQKAQGIDSTVLEYKSDEASLNIEYDGMTGNSAKCAKPAETTIDGKKAKNCYFQPNESGNLIVASFLNFNEFGALHFSLRFKNPNFREDAEKIIRSIKFK